MDKKEAITKLEDARDLILEAQYTIEGILPHVNILGVKKMEILEPVTDILKILSQLSMKGNINTDIPIEGMYKMLYHDYKKVCQEKKDLQKDVVALMSDKQWDLETASLNLKLMRAEREIEDLHKKLESKKEKISYLKAQKTDLRHKLKELGYNIQNVDEDNISSAGYVVSTLEATLWLFLNSNDYNTTILKAVNLGEDTDTVAACTGGLLGIYYGIDNIQDRWKQTLKRYDYIIDLCNKFDNIKNK